MEKKLPDFFELLLGLVESRYVIKVEHKELEVHIDFKRGVLVFPSDFIRRKIFTSSGLSIALSSCE